MTKILYLFVFLGFTSFAEDGKGIKFTEGSWSDIKSEAKKQNKLIFIDIYTTWCGPCKVMSEKVFTDAQVGGKFNETFINYKIDSGKSSSGLISFGKCFVFTFLL